MSLLEFYDWMQGRVRVGQVPDGFDQPCLHWLRAIDRWGSPKASHPGLAAAWGYSRHTVAVRRAAFLADDQQRRRQLKRSDYITPGCGCDDCVEPSHMILRTASQNNTGRMRTLESRMRMSLTSKNVKVPNEAIPIILMDPRPSTIVAADWNCSDSCINDIRNGTTRLGARMVVGGPFAQLLR